VISAGNKIQTNQKGDFIMPIMLASQWDKGYKKLTEECGMSPEKAIKGLDIIAASCALKKCAGCTSHDADGFCTDCKGRQDAEYEANMRRSETKGDDNESVMEQLVAEIGKVALFVKGLGEKAKKDYEDTQAVLLKSAPDAQNALAELGQKVKRALGKMDLTAKLLDQKEKTQEEIHARIDGVEARLRGKSTTVAPAAEEEKPKAKKLRNPYDLDNYDTEFRQGFDGDVIEGSIYNEEHINWDKVKVIGGGTGGGRYVTIPFPGGAAN